MEGQQGSEHTVPKRFIGVSLGGARGKTTAIARLEWQPDGRPLVLVEARLKLGHKGGGAQGLESLPADEPARLGYFRDEALIRYLRQWPAHGSVLAVDVPLSFPPCVQCTRDCPGVQGCEVPEVAWMRAHAQRVLPRTGRSDRDKPRVCPYSERAADWVNAYFSGQPQETLSTSVGPLSARAHHLQKRLAPDFRRGHNWVEVSPRTAIARAMGEDLERKTRRGSYEEVWLARRDVLLRAIAGLEVRGVWPDLVARNVHVFRALVCAWLGYRWHLCSRPAQPRVQPRNDAETQLAQRLDPAMNWSFWDDSL